MDDRLELRRKGLKSYQGKDDVHKRNLKETEVKRYAMFYAGKNAGQFPLFITKNVLNILPASNFGAELLVRHILWSNIAFLQKKQKN